MVDMNILEANNIYKSFSNHTALNDISLSIEEGSIHGLLGPNGAGKTTFIRIINQILAPDKGEILFNNEPLNKNHIYQIGYLPEERGLYKKMRVGEQALYLAQLKGLSKKDARDKLNYWFDKYDISSWWNKKVEELSKGMQQKIQFIVTILHEPRLIIFDEPFSGFDPINTEMLKQDILELKDKGSTIIFSTHNMSSVEELCDNITLIHNAQNILSGNMHDIRKRYRDNIYQIVFEGDANHLYSSLKVSFQIESMNTQQGVHTVKIRLKESIRENDLLSMLIQKVNIISFREVLPGMLDIFIKTVRESISK